LPSCVSGIPRRRPDERRDDDRARHAQLGPAWRRVEVDCRHATTGVSYANGDAVQFTDADMARVALARHHGEEGCRCTRKLWREYFGCPLGEIALVVGQP
jgi:hypothetical protein